MHQQSEFDQLTLKFTDPIQYDYEVIRPIMLEGQTVGERSAETDVPRTTVSDKAKRFVVEGMLGLVDKRSTKQKSQQAGFEEPIANYILYLKQLYPPIKLREIVRILSRKFGYQTNHHKVKRFLERNPVPVQLEMQLEQFHEFEEAYQARWTVVRMYHEGWNKKSIAELLNLSRQHVTRLIKTFEAEGFAGLEDKRTRPADHPHNQLTLPFMESVFRAQLDYPDAGRFRLHGILEQQMGEETPSESTVGRAMAHNRFWHGAPDPLKTDVPVKKEDPAELPYKPRYHHQYWFIDIRYLVKFDGSWVYSICIVEGVSRTIVAGMASRYQDEIAILQLLHAAFTDYGLPWGIVSDNGSVFKAEAFMRVLEGFDIQPCPIEKRQPWQNLIESQFNIQRRLADAHFKRADTFAEIEQQHATFIQLFNTTRHWGHRNRTDDRLTPVAVLDGRLGRTAAPETLSKVFRHLQFSRLVNQHGLVSVQRFYIYAERGLAKQRVSVWIYQDRLNIQFRHTLLARYGCSLDRSQKQIQAVDDPNLYRTVFVSPQLELFTLDDDQWLKVLQRPPYADRKLPIPSDAQQMLLFSSKLLLLILLFPR